MFDAFVSAIKKDCNEMRTTRKRYINKFCFTACTRCMTGIRAENKILQTEGRRTGSDGRANGSSRMCMRRTKEREEHGKRTQDRLLFSARNFERIQITTPNCQNFC